MPPLAQTPVLDELSNPVQCESDPVPINGDTAYDDTTWPNTSLPGVSDNVPNIVPHKTSQWHVGNIIFSGDTFYEVKSVLMWETFGPVVKCFRIKDRKLVMIKMFQNSNQSTLSAQTEINILRKLRKLDQDRSHFVRFQNDFVDRAFTCLLFEDMEVSLLTLMKERQPHDVDLKTIRVIIKQVALALCYLESMNIIHADLKLQNVLLVRHTSQPWTVKVFGFDKAHEISEAYQGRNIQALAHQSPEIILGLPYNAAVDVWSLGCISAALYLGAHLYPGRSPHETLKYITQTQGKLPDTMLNQGLYTSQFFQRDASTGSWELLELSHPEESFLERNVPLEDNRIKVLSSLQDFRELKPLDSNNPMDKEAEMQDVNMFVHLLEGMLQLDAAKRLTPCTVVQHPFVSMAHLSQYPDSVYVTSSQRMMETPTQPSQ